MPEIVITVRLDSTKTEEIAKLVLFLEESGIMPNARKIVLSAIENSVINKPKLGLME